MLSVDNSMFNFLRRCQILFRRGCPVLCSANSTRGQFLQSLADTCSCVFLILAVPVGERCFRSVVWVCVSLTAADVGHFFRCSLALRGSSLEMNLGLQLFIFLFTTAPVAYRSS